MIAMWIKWPIVFYKLTGFESIQAKNSIKALTFKFMPSVKETVNISEKHFPLAAIGASAGGLEAITAILSHLPEKTGIAYVYIQHLDPSHKSNLASILGRQTKIPVLEATDDIPVEVDHIYIIPPNKEMTMVDGVLSVSPRPVSPYSHMPINRFFISLSESHKEAAIGIILSGTATDGTLGLKAIKAAGGITMVQDASAKFQSMPQSAIHEGVVDLVLSPEKISEELVRLVNHKAVYESAIDLSNTDAVDDQNFSVILNLLQKSIGIDFSSYKMTTITRRIGRRMLIYSLKSYKEYLDYLNEHPAEINLLYQDLLINVTSFFRDKECTDYLLQVILPAILKTKTRDQPVRIWVPACSTGQEAYSIAMMMRETLGDESHTSVQIFATDLSENAINKGRLGIYKSEEVAEVPEQQLQRFFKKIDGSYRIIKSIRDMCIFATHNVIKDPPFSRLDVISCCNLLIYLNNSLQRKVLSTFHYSLNNNGYLVLGKSESVSTASQLFSQSDKKLKIYTKKKETGQNPLFDITYRPAYRIDPAKIQERQRMTPDITLEKKVEQLLLKKYIPASVLINGDLDILQFHGSTGLYLEAAPGRASLNLLKMARPELAFDFRNLIHKAKKSGEATKKTGIEIMVNNILHKVTVEAMPVKHDVGEEYYLVVFEEEAITEIEKDHTSTRNKRVVQLEDELQAARDDMRSLVEAQEATNEELQSANEEIVSSNEELQSINEELETSKEEIESSNEELMTMNQELQVRNALLAEVQEYSEAILATVRESIVVLDYDYRIKSVNQSFVQKFHIVETEVEGRFLSDISNKLWELPELKILLDEIVRKNKEFRDFEVLAPNGDGNTKKLLLNARRIVQKIHGQHLILLAIEDVSGL